MENQEYKLSVPFTIVRYDGLNSWRKIKNLILERSSLMKVVKCEKTFFFEMVDVIISVIMTEKRDTIKISTLLEKIVRKLMEKLGWKRQPVALMIQHVLKTEFCSETVLCDIKTVRENNTYRVRCYKWSAALTCVQATFRYAHFIDTLVVFHKHILNVMDALAQKILQIRGERAINRNPENPDVAYVDVITIIDDDLEIIDYVAIPNDENDVIYIGRGDTLIDVTINF